MKLGGVVFSWNIGFDFDICLFVFLFLFLFFSLFVVCWGQKGKKKKERMKDFMDVTLLGVGNEVGRSCIFLGMEGLL